MGRAPRVRTKCGKPLTGRDVGRYPAGPDGSRYFIFHWHDNCAVVPRPFTGDGTLRSRYLAAAILALTLPIAVFPAVGGPLALAFLELGADGMPFLVTVAFALGALAIVGVVAQPRIVGYNTRTMRYNCG